MRRMKKNHRDKLYLINYREIILKSWQKLFEKIYLKPGVTVIKNNKTS